MLILERPWKRQPQQVGSLNLGSVFAKAGGFVIHCGAGAYEYATQQQPSVNTATVSVTPVGKALAYSGTNNTRFANARGAFATAGPMTFAALIDVDALTSFSGVAACQQTTVANGWELRLGSGATDSRLFWLRAGPSGYQTYTGSAGNTITAGDKQVFVAVVHNASTTSDPAPTFVVNSTSYTGTAGAGTGGAYGGTTSDLWLGRRYDGATQLTGKIHWAYFVPMALSASQLQVLRLWFYGNLFRPLRIYIPTAAATGYTHPTLSAATATEIGTTSFKPRVTYTFA